MSALSTDRTHRDVPKFGIQTVNRQEQQSFKIIETI